MNEKTWADGPRPSFFGQLSPALPASTAASPGGDPGWLTASMDVASGNDDGRAVERERYVGSRLIQRFMRENHVRRLIAAGLAPILAAICWRHVPGAHLAAWLGALLLVEVARFFAARTYARHYAAARVARVAFLRRMMPLWFASAAVWGMSAALFFNRIPVSQQYLCWMILAAVVSFPIISLALHPPVLRLYVNSFFAVTLGCVAYRLSTTTATVSYELWALLLPLVHWLFLFHVGRHLHAIARKNYGLLFDKNSLIDSLAAKNRQAEQAVQTKNRFLATAAHDMRQPVMALSIYADHLLQVPDQHAVVVPKIAKAAAAVNRLFDSLFELARLDNVQTKVRPEAIDISEVMHDLHVQYEPMAQAKSIELRMRTARQTLVTDPNLLRRMIGNLVANAIKYSPPGRKVLMVARVRSAGVVIDICDQGIGIPPDQLGKIFLEFYKVDASGASEGFGLGLSIVARLAHVLGTRVSVRSQLGRGTVFRLAMGQAAGTTQSS